MDVGLTIHRVCIEQAAWVWNCSTKAIASVEGSRRGGIHEGFG